MKFGEISRFDTFILYELKLMLKIGLCFDFDGMQYEETMLLFGIESRFIWEIND
jgi:hypothetical protein